MAPSVSQGLQGQSHCSVPRPLAHQTHGVDLLLVLSAPVSTAWPRVGPSCFLPSFVYQALLTAPFTGEPFGSVWTFFIPCPAGLFPGGTCTVNQVFTFTPDDFSGTNHVFHHLHFLYFNKNGDEKLPTWLLGK